ncbi:hypothetical protein PMAYCL1PPCAC_13075, partial [Pristionchus mayeri]
TGIIIGSRELIVHLLFSSASLPNAIPVSSREGREGRRSLLLPCWLLQPLAESDVTRVAMTVLALDSVFEASLGMPRCVRPKTTVAEIQFRPSPLSFFVGEIHGTVDGVMHSLAESSISLQLMSRCRSPHQNYQIHLSI